VILHGYWRSSAAYRVRIALAIKGLAYQQVTHDLRTGEHRAAAYRALNPQARVPALEADGRVLTQTPAILEWLEERWPEPALLPASAADRAAVRAMCATVACDIHPLNNLAVLQELRAIGAEEATVAAWIARWIGEGFAAIEPVVAAHGAGFAWGEMPGLADCYLVPQVYNAERFGVDLSPFPALMAAVARARALPAFEAAHPDRQPDAAP